MREYSFIGIFLFASLAGNYYFCKTQKHDYHEKEVVPIFITVLPGPYCV